MNFLRDLINESSSLVGGFFVELEVAHHDSSDRCRLQCLSSKGGCVTVKFLNGVPPVIETGSVIAIWDFSRETSHNELIICLDLKGPTNWVIRQPSGKAVDPRFAEFCCGLGGWTQGLRCLMGKNDFKPLMLLDHDVVVAEACARTLGMELISLQQAFDMICGGSIPKEVVIHGDLYDKKTWCILGFLKIHHLCISTPCQPWSGAGRTMGLASRDGRSIAYVVYMAKKTGVKVIELENVPGILKHEHFQELKSFFEMQGFTLAHSGTFEVYPLLPLKRERWIAALVADVLKPPPMAAQWVENVKFPRISFGSPQLVSRDCIHDLLDLYEVQELTPPTCAFLKMSNLQYLPKSMKHQQGKSVLMSRCIGSQDHMVAVMASYGRQHDLPDDILREKGLYTVLYFDKEKSIAPRYFSPWEIIASMYWPDTLHLPKDVYDCWKAVGNSIAIPHVVLGLFKTHAALLDKSPWGEVIFSLSELLERISSKRIRLSKTHQRVEDFRFLVKRSAARIPGDQATDRDHLFDAGASHAGQHAPDESSNRSPVGLLNSVPVAALNPPSLPSFEHPISLEVNASTVPLNPADPCSRKSRDPLWDAVRAVVNRDHHTEPRVEHRVEIEKTVVVPPPEGGVLSNGFSSKSGFKRVWNPDDTWGFECALEFQHFKGNDISGVDIVPMAEHWSTWNNLFMEAINGSGIEKIWPMTRSLMLVAIDKGWFKVTAVEHQMNVMAMIRAVLPLANPKSFCKVFVDGHEVTPMSVPPGLNRIIIAGHLTSFKIEIHMPDGNQLFMIGDVTTRGIDVLKYVEANSKQHTSCMKLFVADKEVNPSCHIGMLESFVVRIKSVVAVTLPAEIPTVQLPCGLPFPPEHSDLSVTPVPMTIRVAARHPIWSSVRTALVQVDESIHNMLGLLFPDMKSTCELSLFCCNEKIDDHSKVKCLNMNGHHEINFGASKPLPITAVEFVVPVSITDQMKIGTSEWAGIDRVKRWVKSPFQTKPSEKFFPKLLTLVNLAAQYMAHSSSTQTLITIVDGKCVDPRLSIGQIDPNSVIAFRCCPLVGGVKKNEDVKKMLHQQLTARGVAEDKIQARIDSILSCVAVDKLRTFVAETWTKQWDGIKNLAHEGKIRLVTVEELKSFQKSKKLSNPHGDKGSQASSSTASTNMSLKSSVSNLAKKSSLHEVNVDLSYFRANDQPVTELPAESFGPDAKGVSIMHFESAQRFLPPTKLSADYLAIIAIGNVNSNLKGTSNFRMIPATDAVGTPILVPATIVNFGDVGVDFHERNSAKIDSQAAMVIEFSIWKKEVDSWDQIKSPMLFLGQCFGEIKNATIMGSWAIKFFASNKKQAEHAKADYAHGFFRVLETDVDPLLTRSGWNGAYFTPKNDAKKPHPDYMVINVPNHDIQQMKALAQKTVNCLGIVKMPQNLALRCRRENGHTVLKAVFPDLPQPDIGRFEQGDDLFILKHVNVNVKAAELTSALQNLGWISSKAIRPVGSTAWMIAAKHAPPSSHLCLNGDFVVVVPHQKTAANVPKGPQVPITAAFRSKHIGDSPAEVVMDSGTSRLDDIKVSIQGQMQAMIDAKLANHTSQIEVLQQAIHNTNKDVQTLREGQVAAEHRIIGVEQAVQVSTSSLLNQMSSMFTNLQNALTDRLDKFEAKHESEEAKRQRTS